MTSTKSRFRRSLVSFGGLAIVCAGSAAFADRPATTLPVPAPPVAAVAAVHEAARSPISIVGQPLHRWVVTASLKDLGYEKALNDGQIEVSESRKVGIRDAQGAMRFYSKMETRNDLAAMLHALREHVPAPKSQENPVTVFERNRAVYFENQVNDYQWYGGRLQTELKEEYRHGNLFDVPVVKLPAADGEVLRGKASFGGLDEVEHWVRAEKDTVRLPIHPQELQFWDEATRAAPRGTLAVRNGSSERTVHAVEPGLSKAFFKLPLATTSHSMAIRRIRRAGAEETIKKTDFLVEWVNAHPEKAASFAFLPEPLAIVSKKNDSAVMVRMTKPYPETEASRRGWTVPVYTLWAEEGQPKPLLAQLMDQRPDPKVDPLDYAMNAILRPIIENSLTLHIDLGAAFPDHGQNINLEIGADGRPTGRIVNIDLQALHPNPHAASDLSPEQFKQRYGFEARADDDRFDSTFRDHFDTPVLDPLKETLSKQFPARKEEINRRIDGLVQEGVERRRAFVTKHQDALPQWYERLEQP